MKYILSIVVLFFVSCSTESNVENTNQNPEAQITGFKNKRIFQSTDPSFQSFGYTTGYGVVQNGKLIEINQEFFDNNGSGQGVELLQSYVYQNNLLTSHVIHDQSGMPRDLNFFYDSNSKLIGSTMIINNGESYYRFVYVTNDEIYLERITLPYNDVNTQVISRCIAIFDGDDIVQAGKDSNLDGTMDNANYFQYNNGNLVSANYSSESHVLNYSNGINNMNVLLDNSYGKKNRRIVGIECFSFAGFQSVLDYSKNLSTDEISGATYEILPSNYYHLKTKSYPYMSSMYSFPITVIETTEFFFN